MPVYKAKRTHSAAKTPATTAIAANYTTQKKGKGCLLVVILFILIVALAGTLFYLYTLLFGTAGVKNRLTPTGKMDALYVTSDDYFYGAATTVEEQQAALQQLVETALKGGYNTLVVNVRNGQQVIYRDKYLSTAPTITANDKLFSHFDPLDYLGQLTMVNNLALYAQVDLYAAGTTWEAHTLAAKYADALVNADGTYYFTPANTRLAADLTDSLANLAARYPLNGIVLTGIDKLPEADVAVHLAAIKNALKHSGCALGVSVNDTENSLDGLFALLNQTNGSELLQFVMAQYSGTETFDTDYSFLRSKLGASAALYLNTVGSNPLVATQQLFYAQLATDYNGCVYTSEKILNTAPETVALMKTTTNTVDAMPQFTLPIARQLAIGYPSNPTSSTYATSCFIMGSSAPEQPLYMNGNEIVRDTAGGTFGILVNLEPGDNTFVFTQNDITATVVITRQVSSGTGSGGKRQYDDTVTVNPGTYVQVIGQYISSLYDEDDDGAIAATLELGMTGKVTDNVVTVRNGKYTYAYLLSSGDYVLASRVTPVSAPVQTVLNGIAVAENDRGRTLTLQGIETPVIYDDMRDGVLTLDIYDVTLDTGFLTSLPAGVTAQPMKDEDGAELAEGVTLTLSLPNEPKGIWSYDVQLIDGHTQVVLYKSPTLSADPLKPLSGVTVMLDAGHGGSDTGALGILGAIGGPTEAALNLALAQATQYRLEQLGATVIMTRSDDTFPTLQDRVAAAETAQPDFFIALHHNSRDLSNDGYEVSQLECYYFDRNSKAFAQSLLDNVGAATNRAVTDPRWNYFYVTRITCAPSVLFEYGYLVNPQQYESCADTYDIYRAACGTANAIVELCR
ncbi:MAG: N-acetylmuramoyl-L-alanine amidase [Oscillospiraceae bacterium]|nr:N-acetylmuramoyl-L-alanine amidase [Oscillospiraceae bacterium]